MNRAEFLKKLGLGMVAAVTAPLAIKAITTKPETSLARAIIDKGITPFDHEAIERQKQWLIKMGEHYAKYPLLPSEAFPANSDEKYEWYIDKRFASPKSYVDKNGNVITRT